MHAVVLKLSLTSPVNLGDLYFFLLDENKLLKSEKVKIVELELFFYLKQKSKVLTLKEKIVQ